MQESRPGGRDPSQEALVERLKAALAVLRLSPQEAEEKINELVGQPGGETLVSWGSITNYREGRWKRLTKRMERALEKAVTALESLIEDGPPDAAAGDGWADGYRAAVEEMEAILARMRKVPTRGAAGALAAVQDAATPRGGVARPANGGGPG